jgi:hypothetical protein
VLAAFFAAFSAWSTRLRSKPDRCIDFFDPNAHARLQKIQEFLLGPIGAGDEGGANLTDDDSLLASASAGGNPAPAPTPVDYSAFYSDSAAQIVAATAGVDPAPAPAPAPAPVDYSAFYSDSAAQIVATTQTAEVQPVDSQRTPPAPATVFILVTLASQQQDEFASFACVWQWED